MSMVALLGINQVRSQPSFGIMGMVRFDALARTFQDATFGWSAGARAAIERAHYSYELGTLYSRQVGFPIPDYWIDHNRFLSTSNEQWAMLEPSLLVHRAIDHGFQFTGCAGIQPSFLLKAGSILDEETFQHPPSVWHAVLGFEYRPTIAAHVRAGLQVRYMCALTDPLEGGARERYRRVAFLVAFERCPEARRSRRGSLRS